MQEVDIEYCSYNFKYIGENICIVNKGKLFIEIINNHQVSIYISHKYFLFNVLSNFYVSLRYLESLMLESHMR